MMDAGLERRNPATSIASPIADRVNGERLVVLGWPRAILLQLAHPLIAAGVADHSTFRADRLAPVRRLRGTVRSMLGLTFGDEAEHDRVIDHIRSIHRRVNGTLREAVGPFPRGTRYSAEDPALVLWVHATLLDTAVLYYERLVGPLSHEERDEYCRASADVAVALGADPSLVPRSWDALTRQMTRMLGTSTLTVGSDARALASAILTGSVVRVSGPAGLAAARLTIGFLPDVIRRQYGLHWSARDASRLDCLTGWIRALRGWTPDVAARWRASRRVRRTSLPFQRVEPRRTPVR
jgi:uncharacterized protein (DUF2236 family)